MVPLLLRFVYDFFSSHEYFEYPAYNVYPLGNVWCVAVGLFYVVFGVCGMDDHHLRYVD